jgi:hypothetical protein
MKAAADTKLATKLTQVSRETWVELPADQDFATAIVALDMYDMLAPEDKEKYGYILNNAKFRATLWKERRQSA